MLADEEFVVFCGHRPIALVHVLMVHGERVASVSEIEGPDFGVAGRMLQYIARTARAVGVEESGYRVTGDSGRGASRQVDHVRRRILGGRRLGRLA